LLLQFVYLQDLECQKSGTETWRLADARCPAGNQCRYPTFAGSPIPALSITPQRVMKKSILSLLYLKSLPDEHVQNGPVFLRESLASVG